MAEWKTMTAYALAMSILALVLRLIESWLTMGYYMDPTYFSVWSKLMMPEAGPPPLSFTAYSFLFSFVCWYLFAFVYGKLSRAISGDRDLVNKGMKFGAMVFLISGIPYLLTTYLLINLPAMLIVVWSTTSLILYLLGGALVAKMVRQ